MMMAVLKYRELTTKAMRCLATMDDIAPEDRYRGYIVGEGFFESRHEVDQYIEACSVPGEGLQKIFAQYGVHGVVR